jgi:hypothetical protein
MSARDHPAERHGDAGCALVRQASLHLVSMELATARWRDLQKIPARMCFYNFFWIEIQTATHNVKASREIQMYWAGKLDRVGKLNWIQLKSNVIEFKWLNYKRT